MTNVIRNCVKEGTFLDAYLRWNAPLETPLAYDFWCGMWLLSSAIGRQIHIPRPGAPVYLNLYIVLCADAGITRKSTAVARAMETYNAVGLANCRKTVTGSITPEAFTTSLALQSRDRGTGEASLVSSELVRLLGREAYSGNMPGLLTDLYDCPTERTVERSGSVVHTITNVHITFLGASTAAWLARAINPDVVEGGFTSRCLFIVDEKRKRRVAWPTGASNAVPADVQQLLLRAQDNGRRFSSKGIGLSDGAMARFVQWYERRDDSSSDPFVSSFESREDHHVLRCAALLAANDDYWIVEARHVDYAIALIDAAKQGGAALFGAGSANLRLVAGLDKLREALMSAGVMGMAQTDVLFKTRSYLKAVELQHALNIMHELQMVQRFDIATSGRPKIIWRATSKIADRTCNEDLRERFTA